MKGRLCEERSISRNGISAKIPPLRGENRRKFRRFAANIGKINIRCPQQIVCKCFRSQIEYLFIHSYCEPLTSYFISFVGGLLTAGRDTSGAPGITKDGTPRARSTA